jgi:site-specific recombinase XerD
MTTLAPHLTAFFEQRLPLERGASAHTRDSYAYAFKLLVTFASQRLAVTPSQLTVEQIDAALVTDFLRDLEQRRSNRPSSRNVRLAAIKSFMHFLEHRLPVALQQIRRILAIPTKQTTSRLVRHLTIEEMQAILDAPDPTTWSGIRDRALLHLCYAGGLRVSELIGVTSDDLVWQPQPTVLIHGKGRRERCLPLWKTTAAAVRAWMAIRGPARGPEVFVNRHHDALTRAGVEYILRQHVQSARQRCPSLATKRVSPHVLRHTCALTVLQATKDLRKVSLWLGHAHLQTTEVYTRADPSVKLEALEAVMPPTLRSGRFKASDQLIASLTPRTVMRSEGRTS